MRLEYSCPHCEKLLNPGSEVVFVVEHQGERAIVLLSATLGDYSTKCPPNLSVEPGTLCTFRCPLCNADLTSSLDEKLVDIVARTDDGGSVRVSFSRVYGERATFVFAEDKVERYGEHASRYDGLNFFGEAADPEID
jgi:hypothetical protein